MIRDLIAARRLTFATIGLGCVALLANGYYLQFFQGIEPCPMCIFQRVAYFAIALVALAGAMHGPGRVGCVVYGSLVFVIASIGGSIAARQTWLQHLPPGQVPECGGDLAFMLEVYSAPEAILRILRGTGDCAEVDWTFLGWSIAEWSLVCFITIALTAVVHVVARLRTAGARS